MSIVVRIRRDDYEKLEALRKLLGLKRISEVISLAVKAAEEEIERFQGNPDAFLKSLKYAGEAGEKDSEQVDELLYGESSGHNN